MRAKNSNYLSSFNIFLCLGIIIFWGLRVVYWTKVHELPFSDMADFERIAKGIMSNWDFGHDSFFQSYKSPSLPVLGAMIWTIFGEGNYDAWRWFSASLVFVSACFLTAEIFKATQSKWLSLGFLWSVALAKPSVFWSYKYSTESLSEALVYLSAALWLYSFRRDSLKAMFFLGLVTSVAILNRPNYIVIVPLVLGALVVFSKFRGVSVPGLTLKRRALLGIVFSVGVLTFWAPWMARSYSLYGHFVPMNTSGGHSFIFDLGRLEVTLPDGTEVAMTNDELLAEAPTRFANDYESHTFAMKMFVAWLKQDPLRYVNLVLERTYDTLWNHSVYLTKVSRFELFSSGLDKALFDKSGYLVIVGFLGLCALGFFFDFKLLVLPYLAVMPWLFAMLVAKTSRYLDPMVSILGFGCFAFLYLLISQRQKFLWPFTRTSPEVAP